jgi:type I restriction enzyme S subunit
MAKTLYDYWFVQFDFPDASGKPYKSSGGKMVYNATLKREIPEGWKEKQLCQIANITMGTSSSGDSLNDAGDGVEFFRAPQTLAGDFLRCVNTQHSLCEWQSGVTFY